MYKLENGKKYLVNGVPCTYNDGIFFWEDEDSTKWFFASSLKPDTEIEIL